MTANKTIRRICLSLAIMALAFNVNATDYIKHEAKKGETLYGIAHKYNVSYKQLEELNPQAASGVKKGMTILVPVDGDAASNVAVAPTDKPAQQTPANKPVEAPTPVETAKDAPAVVPEIYYAKSGDTFTSIAHKYGMTVDQLIDLNPFVDPNKIKIGSPLRLTASAPLSGTQAAPTDETELTIVVDDRYYDLGQQISGLPVPAEPVVATEDDETDEIDADTPADITIDDEWDENNEIESLSAPLDESVEDNEQTVLIVLPFMANAEKLDKQAVRYGDFYRGFLVGLEDATPNFNHPIDVVALDTYGDPERMQQQLRNSLARDTKIMIAPEDDASLAIAAKFAEDNGIYLLNLFNVRDESYRNNPYILQANISQALMYEKAINFFLNEYSDFTPVILISDGRTEKMPFVEALSQRYSDMGVEPITIQYTGQLKAQDLAQLDEVSKYVFVPTSGAMSEFNKFARTLVGLKSRPQNIDRFAIFGYPDWTAFRSDALGKLHELEATVYSRFYYDETADASKALDDKYYGWYGSSMTEGVPMQSVLGYDAANLIIRMMRANMPLSDVLSSGARFRGRQSTFHFVHPVTDVNDEPESIGIDDSDIDDSDIDEDYNNDDNDGFGYNLLDGTLWKSDRRGYVNDALYIIKFLPNRVTDVRVL